MFVHGYAPIHDPRSGDPAPMLELAAQFHEWGFSSLVINLGYATGAHPFSGGALEADDVTGAVRWSQTQGSAKVAVWGFSAGGSAALLASARGAPVVAVAADSAFADAPNLIVGQIAKVTHLPSQLFVLVPPMMSIVASPGPVDLDDEFRRHPIAVPVLLFQGTRDRAVFA